MKKSEINELFRKYVRDHLSPTKEERGFVSNIYSALCAVLGSSNCIQIGSYPRFTATTPVHDLDTLYIIGDWIGPSDPGAQLRELKQRLETQFQNPTGFNFKISLQTHSITISFLRGTEEVFAVDVVPAYRFRKNEFGQDKYMVPEIFSVGHYQRKRMYDEFARTGRSMGWIPSDPRGYIEVAKRINEKNPDFRKSVKFVKAWAYLCKGLSEDFKLKSFHIEQVITQYFAALVDLEIFDAVFTFFCDLPSAIERAQIPDRADHTKMIDSYVDELTDDQRQLIIHARDHFLIKLESFADNPDVEQLLEPGFHKRAGNSEEYLFDSGIPVLLEPDAKLSIRAKALQRTGGFRERVLDALGLIDIDRKIEFRLANGVFTADLYKWKVKNDNNSVEPRGEITDHRTRNDPESTKYKGQHFVECYAIKNGVCIARAKQLVVLTNGL